ncbi:MAG TPA: peroxidase-related enzyme [Candidatus Thermoplasmatota archaeon]|jgi:uncharacterized peroxidase-related enzyme|nr:peroxidase-related enzyme [Candidatus Thermoplasmatota archaeon]
MAFLPLLPPPAGTPAAEVLRETEARWGYAPNIVRALAMRPELLQAEDAWSKALMYSGLLPRTLKEAVATTVSVVNKCDYCATSHAYAGQRAGQGPEVAQACARLRFDGLPERDRAALEFARKAASDMNAITQRDVDALRAHFSPQEIVELAAVIGSFMLYNTFVTALGLELEPQHGASLLATKG